VSLRGTHSNEHSLSIDSLTEQLLRRPLLDEDAVRHRKEAPDTSVGSRRDVKARILQRLGVLVDQAVKDGRILGLKTIRSAVEAPREACESEVGLRWDPVRVAVLLREVWR